MLTSRHFWLQETGTSFNITPKKGGSFTPSKMLLMQRERRMNMLTPEQGSKMFNADIETGKILNEWSFQKDGVDIDIKDISNDTRAAGLDDRDTFLGLGGNRCAGSSIYFYLSDEALLSWACVACRMDKPSLLELLQLSL